MTKPPVETDLFIGGPWDGRHVMVQYAKFHDILVGDGAEAGAYRKELIAGERETYAIWRWNELSLDDTLRLLCEGYRSPPAGTDAP